jgi:hypothetical protein
MGRALALTRPSCYGNCRFSELNRTGAYGKGLDDITPPVKQSSKISITNF